MVTIITEAVNVTSPAKGHANDIHVVAIMG